MKMKVTLLTRIHGSDPTVKTGPKGTPVIETLVIEADKGETIEVSDAYGKQLIEMGYAKKGGAG